MGRCLISFDINSYWDCNILKCAYKELSWLLIDSTKRERDTRKQQQPTTYTTADEGGGNEILERLKKVT